VKFASHIVVSTCVFAVVLEVSSKGQWGFSKDVFISFAMVLLGTMLPDIDHPDSVVGKRVKWLSYPIRLVFGHRGITHSVLAVGFIAFAAISLDWWWLNWLALGYAGHLLGDYLTDAGIPAFWPNRKRYRFVLVGSTGGLSEFVMVALVVLVTGLLFWVRL